MAKNSGSARAEQGDIRHPSDVKDFRAHPERRWNFRECLPSDDTDPAKRAMRRNQRGWMTIVFRNGEIVPIRLRPQPHALPQATVEEAALEGLLIITQVATATLALHPHWGQDPQ